MSQDSDARSTNKHGAAAALALEKSGGVHASDSRGAQAAMAIDHSKLRQLRQGRGWSQRKVADDAGMEPRQYARYERGEVLCYPGRGDTHKNLQDIAALFGLNVTDLLLARDAAPTPRVLRPEARLLARRLLLPGKPVPIQAPWRFGKATLLSQCLDGVLVIGADPLRVARLDLRDLAPEAWRSFNEFLGALGQLLAERITGGAGLFARAWQGSESAASKLGWFLHDHLLSERGVLVLLCEHMERVQETPFHDSLFALLRGWAESAVKEPRSHWPRLRIVVTIATEPELLETVADHSGFFAASAPMIKLGSFTPAQVAELAAAYRLPEDPPGLRLLQELVDGQPYLVDLALSEAALREVSLPELLKADDFRGGIFEQHLSALRKWLEKSGLLGCAGAVLRGERLARRDYCRAYSIGLLREVDHNEYRFQCELYRTYFGALCN